MNAVRDSFLRRARILNVTEEEYFADPCATPSLSQSIANVLVTESPRHAWLRHPRLGKTPEEGTRALDDGSVLHKLLLGKGAAIEVIAADNYKTKLAQELRDAAITAGKVPVLASRFAEIGKAAAALRNEAAAQGFSLTGESEVAIEWIEEAQNAVLCRGRLDHVFQDRGVIYDVKKTRNASPAYLARQFVELGYDMQYAAYTRALTALHPEFEGRVDFVFLFMEIEPPYSVVPVRPDGAFKEIGTLRWRRAVEIWEACLTSNRWPGYCSGAITLNAPVYVINRELGNSEGDRE